MSGGTTRLAPRRRSARSGPRRTVRPGDLSRADLRELISLKDGSIMTERSRRNFLKSATITGAVAGVALLPAGLAGAAAGPAGRPPGAAARPGGEPQGQAAPTGQGAGAPVVAYVKDAATGRIAVMAGEHEYVHVDP